MVDEKSGKPQNLCEVCQQPTDRKCSGCKLVYYCTFEHQKENWKIHREKCLPYETGQSKDVGRYLKTTRDLEPGDLIFTEFPLIHGPKTENERLVCIGCCRVLNRENYQKCPECAWPCCPQCPHLNDNLRHALECSILKAKPVHDLRFDIITPIRVLLLQNTNKTKFDQVLKLEDHLERRGPGTKIYSKVEEKIKFLADNYIEELLKSFPDVSLDLIRKIYAILDVNAVELTGEYSAIALYPIASLLEHDCTPNTTLSIDENDNFRITYRAALPLLKNDHITTTYIDTLQGTYPRRVALHEDRYFWCCCDRCRDPTELGTFLSALKCLGEDERHPCGGTQLPNRPLEEKNKWVCSKCKIKLPNRQIMEFVQHLGGQVNKALKEPTITELEDILGKLLTFFHPNHYHVNAIKYTLIQLYTDTSDETIAKKMKMCQSLIDIAKQIDPGCARLGIHLGTLYKELVEAKFLWLSRHFPESRNRDQIEQLASLLDENKKVLQNDLRSKAGTKLYQVVCDNEAQFKAWVQENDHL